jgi:hypothetical protein
MKNLLHFLLFIAALSLPLQVFASTEWEWTSTPTPGALNHIESVETSEDTAVYDNGTLSTSILLSEVMPNPEGTDNDYEWIEIYNEGTEDVNLGNWSLDDEEAGSDPYQFPSDTIIEAQDFLVIYRPESGLALNNDTDQVRLFDFQDTLIDSVTYETAPEGEAYARIILEGPPSSLLSWLIPTAQASTWEEANWEWTSDITTGFSNPIYQFIEGEITEILPFSNKMNLTFNGTPIEITLSDLDLNDELKNNVFQVGNVIKGYAKQLAPNLFELKTFEQLNPPQAIVTKPTNKIFSIVGLILSLIALVIINQKKQGPIRKTSSINE